MSAYMLSGRWLAILSRAIVSIFKDEKLNGMDIRISESSSITLRHAVLVLSRNIAFDEEGVFRALERMNALALQARYGDDIEMHRADLPTKWPPASTIQIYKGFRSYLYQCSEGDVDRSKLYAAIVEIRDKLANKIVMSLPEYDQAEWCG